MGMIIIRPATMMIVWGVVIGFYRPIDFENYEEVSFKSNKPPIKIPTVWA